MKKNDIVRLEITALTAEGSGVGRYDGMAVFVPNTAVGDVIECKLLKLKSSYAYGKIEKIISASSDRVDVDCPVYSRCGGCCFRHISYEAELRAKEGFVKDSFQRIGGFGLEPEPILGCKDIYNYRNKAQFPVSKGENGSIYGFFSPRSHNVIGIQGCLIQPEIFSEIAGYIVKYIDFSGIQPYDEKTGSGLLRHIYLRIGAYTKEIMVTLVVTANTHSFDRLVAGLTASFPQIKTVVLNINPERTNVILGKSEVVLFGSGRITDIMCGLEVDISSHSFYQVNTFAAENVYALAREYAGLSGSETLLDLYCGIGTVGLSMRDRVAKLIGVEVIPEAVLDARHNAERNGVKNAEFICGDAGKVSQELSRSNTKLDVIIVDPPRKGCDKATLDAILSMSPKQIVYISCNHATAARDSKYLCENGYNLIKYRPCDMFPRTGHVETVVLLSKGEVDSKKIRVEFSLEDMDMSEFQDGATYPQIKEYVLEHTGLKVSNLYISQIKRKCGIEVGKNYNLPKSEDSRQPQCPPEKEKAIREAFKYFGMI